MKAAPRSPGLLKRKPFLGLLAGLAITTLVLVAELSGATAPLNRLALDYKAAFFPRQSPDPRIVLVAIDESSLAEIGQRFKVYWPWPREFFGLVLGHLNSQKPAAVVFDILFDTPDADRLTTSGPESDRRFAAAIEESGVAILAAHVPGLSAEREREGPLRYYPFRERPPAIPGVIHPLPDFARAAAGVGNTRVNPDGDGVIRTVPLLAGEPGGLQVPALSLAVYQALAGSRTAADVDARGLQLNSSRVPLTKGAFFRLDWYQKSDSGSSYPQYRFYDLFVEALKAEAGKGSGAAPFAGKIVFFGATAAGLSDIKSTPISGSKPVPGVEIQMQALNNLLDERFLRVVSTATAAIAVVLAIALPLGLALWMRPLASATLTVLFLSALLAVDCALFQFERQTLPTATWMAGAMLATLTGVFVKYWIEERHALMVRRAFACYVQPAVAEEIARHPEALGLGGERREVTLMFSDLAGFTTMSEGLEPEQLVGVMNEYFDAMTEIILDSGGTVDKFIGDAVMAFWGAPKAQADHAYQACRAVLAQQRRLTDLNGMWRARGLPPIKARFGVNTGAVIVGNVGGRKRFNYTALGDQVNIAARLEPANTRFGTSAIVSEATYESAKQYIICRELGAEQLKGTSRPTRLYQLLAERAGPDAVEFERLADDYAQVMRLLERGDQAGAVTRLADFLRAHPQDAPAHKLWERIGTGAIPV